MRFQKFEYQDTDLDIFTDESLPGYSRREEVRLLAQLFARNRIQTSELTIRTELF